MFYNKISAIKNISFSMLILKDQQNIMNPIQCPPTRGSQLIVVKAYSPQYFDEMELKEGDIVAFMDELEMGWWRGMKLGNPSPVRFNFKQLFSISLCLV